MLWICLGSGPSLTPEDVQACRPYPVIAINNTVDLAPWASVCFAADYQWWDARKGLPDFKGQRVSLAMFNKERYPNVQVFNQGPITGLCMDGQRLATGKHSGYSAINYAVLCGATTIVLLGYDMQPSGSQHHWHAPHLGDRHPSYTSWLPFYETLKDPLTALGIRVLNASKASAIPASVFPHVPLHEALNGEGLDSHPMWTGSRSVRC